MSDNMNLKVSVQVDADGKPLDKLALQIAKLKTSMATLARNGSPQKLEEALTGSAKKFDSIVKSAGLSKQKISEINREWKGIAESGGLYHQRLTATGKHLRDILSVSQEISSISTKDKRIWAEKIVQARAMVAALQRVGKIQADNQAKLTELNTQSAANELKNVARIARSKEAAAEKAKRDQERSASKAKADRAQELVHERFQERVGRRHANEQIRSTRRYESAMAAQRSASALAGKINDILAYRGKIEQEQGAKAVGLLRQRSNAALEAYGKEIAHLTETKTLTEAAAISAKAKFDQNIRDAKEEARRILTNGRLAQSVADRTARTEKATTDRADRRARSLANARGDDRLSSLGITASSNRFARRQSKKLEFRSSYEQAAGADALGAFRTAISKAARRYQAGIAAIGEDGDARAEKRALKRFRQEKQAAKDLFSDKMDHAAREQREITRGIREQEQARRRAYANINQGYGQATANGARAISYARQSAYVAAGVAAGGIAASRKGIMSAMAANTAETNLKIFGLDDRDAKGRRYTAEEQTTQVADLRKSWLNTEAIKNGILPGTAINSYSEVLKAGIQKEISESVTKSILQGSVAVDLPVSETTKLVGSINSGLFGMSDAKRTSTINDAIRGIAIAAKETRADTTELVSSLSRGMGVTAATKMSISELSAFNSAGISGGMMPGKAGTFADFLVNDIVGSQDLDPHRKKQLAKGLRLAGMGGLRQSANEMTENPAEFLSRLMDSIQGKDEKTRSRIAGLIGMREWRGEMLIQAKANNVYKTALKAQRDPSNKNFLEEGRQKKMASWQGKWNSVQTISALFWESFGLGFDKVFGDITEFFVNAGSTFDWTKISDHVHAFTDGLIKGLGYQSISEMLRKVFGDPTSINFDWTRQLREFGRGFSSGLMAVWTPIKNLIVAMSGTGDSEAIGRLVGKIVGLSAALVVLSPVISVLGVLTSALGLLFGALRVGQGLLGAAGIARGGAAVGVTAGAARGASLLSRLLPAGAAATAALPGAMTAASAKRAIASSLPSLSGGAGLILSRLFSLGLVAEIGANRGQIVTWMLNGFTVVKDALKAVLLEGWNDLKLWIRKNLTLKNIGEKILDEVTPAPVQKWIKKDSKAIINGGRPDFQSNPGDDLPGLEKMSFTFDEIRRNTAATAANYRQAFDPDTTGSIGHLIRPASYESDSNSTAETVRAMGARLQLAALGAGGSAVTGLGSSFSGGGGGGGLSGSSSSLSYVTGGGSVAGSRLSNFGGVRRSLGGSSSGMVGYGANPGAYKPFLDYVAGTEGTAGGKNNGYDVTLANGALLPGKQEQDLTKMTLDQIDAMQTGMLNHPGNRWNSSAAGRYQIVRKTLRGLRQQFGLKGNELYDEKMQDRLGAELARARGANAGALGQEWASLKGGKGSQAASLLAQVPRGSDTTPGERQAETAGSGNILADMQRLRQTGAVLNEQCVSLAKAAVGATGSVTTWQKGVGAEAGTLKPGTPLATFLNRDGSQSDRYAGGGTGTPGARLDHAGVFEKYINDAAGKRIGMQIAEQYKGSGGVRSKAYMFGQGFGESNGSNYSAVLGPDGLPLGGDRNPMSLARQASSSPENLAKAAEGSPTSRMGDSMMGRNSNPGGNGAAITAPITINHHGDSAQLANQVQNRIQETRNWQSRDQDFQSA